MLLPLSDDGRFQSLLAAAQGDHAYQALVKAVATRTTSAELGAYAKELDGMEIVGEEEEGEQLVALNDRIVVPESWVSDAIKTAHAHHLGVDLTLQNAKRMFWWPQMSAHIRNTVEGCQACARHQRLAPELPWMKPTETYYETGPNWRHCIDILEIKHQKIALVADWWSGYTWCHNFGRHPTTRDITDWLEHLYRLGGTPSFIPHDGGEQFRNKWKDWCRSLGIKSEQSSSYNPSSNGYAENKVAITKRTILKMLEDGSIGSLDNSQLSKAMCHLMLTPRVNGLSAADLFYGRKVRSPLLPTLIHIGPCRITDEQWKQVCQFKEEKRDKEMRQGPKSRKCPLQMSFRNDYILEHDTTAELKVGDSCLVYCPRQQLWTREATVAEVRPSGRSYWLTENSTGRKLLRSRRHIRRRKGAAIADKAAGKEQVKGVRASEGGASSRVPSTPCCSPPSPPTRTRRSASPPPPSTTPPKKRVRFSLGTKRS